MGKRQSRNGGPISRKRTSTQRNPRAAKRARTENDNPSASDSDSHDGSRHGSSSPEPNAGMPEINEGMSQQQLYQAGRQLQARCNDLAHSQQEAARSALGDITNDADSDEDPDTAAEDERKFIRSLGKKITCVRFLWIPDDEAVFEAVLDDEYNPLERFSKEPGVQPHARIQGAIRDLLEIIPEQYQSPEELQGWVKIEILAGMSDQRYTWRNRLRTHPGIFDRTTIEFSSSAQREQFAESIGRKAKSNNPEEFYYDTFDVPLLHEDYDGEFDIDKIFLNKYLFIVHAALTRGMSGANSLCTGVKGPKVETVEKLWGLKKTTPSMIAGTAVWLRWVHSRDEEFLPMGDVTAIDWAREFDAYM
ncbi:hypothetical protein C8F01DRAFT_1160106 [Mycena amicta]|nr:hypothetical protein C8F01DRAFT_1160106 [Mycena amicta]